MEIRAIIIDDEPNCTESLGMDLARYCPFVNVLEACNSPKQGLVSIRKLKPNLVFLDVQMPWMNGFEMLEVLDKIDFAIIFTTAHDQFAAKAFRLSAVDYLLKPIDSTDLKEAVAKAVERINLRAGNANIDNLLHNINTTEAKQRVAFAGREGFEFVEIGKIVYAEAEGAYTHIHLNDKRKLIISKTLSDVEEMLPPSAFQRIHHSTLINLAFVTHYLKNDGGYIVLNNNEKLIVSKSRRDALLDRLGLK